MTGKTELNRVALLGIVASSLTFSLLPASCPADDADVVAGKRVFARLNCEGCHLNGNNLLRPDRPIKGADFQKRYKDDALLEQTIRKGFPSEGMPAFPKHVVNEHDMKALIAYVRTFTPKNSK